MTASSKRLQRSCWKISQPIRKVDFYFWKQAQAVRAIKKRNSSSHKCGTMNFSTNVQNVIKNCREIPKNLCFHQELVCQKSFPHSKLNNKLPFLLRLNLRDVFEWRNSRFKHFFYFFLTIFNTAEILDSPDFPPKKFSNIAAGIRTLHINICKTLATRLLQTQK